MDPLSALIALIPLSYTDAVVAIGAAIIGLTAGVLGVFAVLRGRSLVGDALAHATLPGVAIGFIVTGAKDAATLLVGAGIACLIAALVMVGIERTSRIPPDSAIGVVLAGFFSLGIVVLTYIAGQGNANQAGLDKYLFGQAAGLLEHDLLVMGALALSSLTAVCLAFRALKVTLFDPDFAAAAGLPTRVLEVAMTASIVVAVVVGVRAVGAILMVALLVAPAVAARQLTRRLSSMLAVAGVIGAAIGVGGALVSMRAELPTGPVIVLLGFVLVAVCVLGAPGRGVLWRAGTLRRDRRRLRNEAVLLDLQTALHGGPPMTPTDFALGSGRSVREVRRALGDLGRVGMLGHQGRRVFLSQAGAGAARAVAERRELWSLWLEHGSTLTLPDAREPDPYDLRASLGDEYADALRALGTTSRREST